ncbi:MAG: Nif3-like dinuclear metal center hexameric protein [Defluviitaleaceae bacterium]|nr:Nif3-like dinuclear metal center hexameric protein [Defluviitaleaceae bacterium]MCL2275511.1 Nif3-like dinuclear metal center hexameric protein [Defluviitaleaceae bacterium]
MADAQVTAGRIIEVLENWAPRQWAEEWDNVGLLLGDPTQPVTKVLVALDATDAVIKEALAGGYDFLITHHPLIHDPLKKITTETVTGRKLLALARAGVGLYAAHTNLDKAPDGVNDCLFRRLHLKDASPLVGETDEHQGIGLVGLLAAPMPLADFAEQVKADLRLSGIRYAGDGGTIIKKAGLCGGDASHAQYWKAAQEKGCDVFITGDLRYHGVHDAVEAGITLVDISHYAGEVWIVDAIVARLKDFAPVFPSKTDGQIFSHK